MCQKILIPVITKVWVKIISSTIIGRPAWLAFIIIGSLQSWKVWLIYTYISRAQFTSTVHLITCACIWLTMVICSKLIQKICESISKLNHSLSRNGNLRARPSPWSGLGNLQRENTLPSPHLSFRCTLLCIYIFHVQTVLKYLLKSNSCICKHCMYYCIDYVQSD